MEPQQKNARSNDQSAIDKDVEESNKRRKLANNKDVDEQPQTEQQQQQQQTAALELLNNFQFPFTNSTNSDNGNMLLSQLSLNASTLLPEDLFTFVTNDIDGRNNSTLVSTDTTANSSNQVNVASPFSAHSSASNASRVRETSGEQEIATSRPTQQISSQQQQPKNHKPNSGVAHSKVENESTAQEQSNTAEALDPSDQSVHTIVVGGRAFRLSWESLKSDAIPTNFFVEHFRKIAAASTVTSPKKRIMHIDRDPVLFEQIVRHLQGYYIRPKDDVEYQALLYDASYYGLTRLRKSLLEYAFINVGGRLFRVSWDLFSKDGRHNFFTGPLRHSLHTPPKGERNAPPLFIDRDPNIFQNIIDHLRGYSIQIRDEEHRKNLLRDAQYYVFRQLYDKVLTTRPGTLLSGNGDSVPFLPDDVSNHLGTEILLKLNDVRLPNLVGPMNKLQSYVQYQRNSSKEGLHTLLLQLEVGELQLHVDRTKKTVTNIRLRLRSELEKEKLWEIAHVLDYNFRVILGQQEAFGVVPIEDHAKTGIIRMDGVEKKVAELQQFFEDTPCYPQNCFEHANCRVSPLTFQRGIFRLVVTDDRIALEPLVMEVITSECVVNAKRQFLT